MRTETIRVDNRVFLLGLDELCRGAVQGHEAGELRSCASNVCQALDLQIEEVPVEGYYAETPELTDYFRMVRTIQSTSRERRREVENLKSYQRLVAVTSSAIYGKPSESDSLLPAGMDPLSRALEELAPSWSLEPLARRAREIARSSDDVSLVGLAAMIGDNVVLTALRESVVLYAAFLVGGIAEPVKYEYLWEVDPELAERAAHFVQTFNNLFSEKLPEPRAKNAEEYWLNASLSDVSGRCVRLGFDATTSPIQHYHWGVRPGPDGDFVEDFWQPEIWTTERYSQSLDPRSGR